MRLITAVVLLASLFIEPVSCKKRKNKGLACTACVRMVASAREKVGTIRETLAPMLDNKLETGRGADRAYNKRFTKAYDIELLHHVEGTLQKSCAQPQLMYDTNLVRSCRTLRDDHADELLELFLHHEDADAKLFCAEIEACADTEAADSAQTWSAPALRSQSHSEAEVSWSIAVKASTAVGPGPNTVHGAVQGSSAGEFFTTILQDGDVVLLLYSTKEGAEFSALPGQWDEVAEKMRAGTAGDGSEADTLSFSVMAIESNDLPIALPIDLTEGMPEVLWFGKENKDMPETFFGVRLFTATTAQNTAATAALGLSWVLFVLCGVRSWRCCGCCG
jgi:hypothetical protein